MNREPGRREFLGSAALLAIGASLAPGRDKETKDPGFSLGIQSYTYRNFDLEPALKRIQEIGFTQAEFYQKHIPLNSTAEQLKALKKLCADYNVRPMAFGVQRFTKDADANKKTFEFGSALGIKAFSADPDPDSFNNLDKLCEEFKIAIAIHPHGPAGKGALHRWYCAEVIMSVVKDHHPLIGSCLDTGHLIRADQVGKKLDPAAEVKAMGKRNFGMHLKDHDNAKHTDVVFGKGPLKVAEVLKALKEVGFKGMISIEYEANPQDPSKDLKACVEIYNKAAQEIS
ncbi:MAG: sugar phosphate isomerase/epimerase [Gemmataceae bacterium]|nr:sugar phosphate isomerase/epimerase [Gemmataceae bacterium]